MHLKNLQIINFKNCSESQMDFCAQVNCFLGNNGQGKTNFLDAIYYLSFCKSYFNTIDSQNIKHEEGFFVIQGNFEIEKDEIEIYCGIKRGQKKSFKKNKKEYSRLSDHIGFIPLVMISPADSALIAEGSETRRKFVDAILSQIDKRYLDELIAYNKVLTQRNALLKQFAEQGNFNFDLMEVVNLQLIDPGNYIFQKRQEFLNSFIHLFSQYYQVISGGLEKVGIEYKSDLLEQNFHDLLVESLQRDRYSGITSKGVHKDDIVFTLDGFPIKKFGSQGQQKSYLIALKLAQYYYLEKIKGKKPILLLDDIFDKLDDERVNFLMELVTGKDFGQVFITDTSLEKLPEMLSKINVNYKVMKVQQGDVI